MSTSTLAEMIVDVPDFPAPGVVFKDITPLLASAAGYAAAVDALVRSAPEGIEVVLGMEARGFIFAGPVALALGAGFVPVRKPGKLPRASVGVDFELEYATTNLAIHADSLVPGARVLVVDDVLATGGTLAATASLIRRLGAELVAASVLVELAYLGGRATLRQHGVEDIASVITVDRP